jgi:apolipoprotein N-acyltransferase
MEINTASVTSATPFGYSSLVLKKILITLGIILSSVCLGLSNGIDGSLGWLLWISFIPILLVSFQLSPWQSFFSAFIVGILCKWAWVAYLIKLIPVVPVVMITLISAAIFAMIIVITRQVVISQKSAFASLTFPVLWVTAEFLIATFTKDGTFGSMAYTMSDYLPVIQIAAVTGLFGITFWITLISSALAVAIYLRKENKELIRLSILFLILIATPIVYGMIRIKTFVPADEMKIGMVQLDEKAHQFLNNTNEKDDYKVALLYAKEVEKLSSEKPDVVLLPEVSLKLNSKNERRILLALNDVAGKLKCTIITGATRIGEDGNQNLAIILDGSDQQKEYQKVNLFAGEVLDNYKSGARPLSVNISQTQTGIAICKDLDFPRYIKEYNAQNISMMFVPAWDFESDAWLHSRMAILRGVENGYSIARNARLGRLTLSSPIGEVKYEKATIAGKNISLTGKISTNKMNTYYSKTGDWFPFFCIVISVFFCFLIFQRMKWQQQKGK